MNISLLVWIKFEGFSFVFLVWFVAQLGALGLFLRHTGRVRASRNTHLFILKAMFASVIVASARVIPIVLTTSPIRLLISAKTCSTWQRIFYFLALDCAVAYFIGRPAGFLRWMRLVLPMPASYSSFLAERYAVSAQTSAALFSGSINPSRSRAPLWAAASVTLLVRLNPKLRSMPM